MGSYGKNHNKDSQHFYENDIWNKELEKIKTCIPKGWQIFGEIIGWDGDKELQKDYTYDVPKSQTELYVYRIACVNPDGVSVDLPWEFVKLFCLNNGIKHVPEFYVGPKSGFNSSFYMDKRFNDMGLDSPKLSLDKWNNGKDDIQIVDEGVVVRLDDNFTPHFYKHKAPLFYLHEGVILDSGVEDVESKESEEENNESV
jgi:hypothetical protein